MIGLNRPPVNALSLAFVNEVIAALRQDRDWRIRLLAAETLGKINVKQIRKPLIEALKDGEWRVRQQAAKTLGKLGDKLALEPLIEILQDEEYGVRYRAVVALKNW